MVKGGEAPASSYAITMTPQKTEVKVSKTTSKTVYRTESLRVEVDNRSGSIAFFASKGKYLTREVDYSMTERDEGADKGSYIVKQGFRLEDSEPVYGLGILQDGKLSLRGKHIRMIQGNTEDFVPVVQSVKGYGIIWDNPSPTVFDSEGNVMSFESEVGECVDYYFIYGGNADKVIAGIRQLTERFLCCRFGVTVSCRAGRGTRVLRNFLGFLTHIALPAFLLTVWCRIGSIGAATIFGMRWNSLMKILPMPRA